VIIDGGKGQLNAALEALAEVGMSVPICGLAKEQEELFLPGRKDSILLPRIRRRSSWFNVCATKLTALR
jgi:excinuclease ABC subunit C